jgi:hypothetical protein
LPSPLDLRASLAVLAAADGEQPGLIHFDEGRGRWSWQSWRSLDAAVAELGAGARRSETPLPQDPRGALAWLLAWAGDDPAAARALGTLPPLPAGPPRPIALLPFELDTAEGLAWLAWGLGAGASLVLPPAADLVPWSLAWTRPSHAAFPAGELAELRAGLVAVDGPRALRRRLRRLRHLVVWGEPPEAGEAAAWVDLGVPLTAWPSR